MKQLIIRVSKEKTTSTERSHFFRLYMKHLYIARQYCKEFSSLHKYINIAIQTSIVIRGVTSPIGRGGGGATL